jgi:ATP-dependent exoDNAse (exonuclease V) alpha subunit
MDPLTPHPDSLADLLGGIDAGLPTQQKMGPGGKPAAWGDLLIDSNTGRPVGWGTEANPTAPRETIARDRTKTEHVAQVSEVKFEKPDGSFIILRLNDGTSAQGPGERDNFSPGIRYRFMGRWKNHPQWGDQFHFTSFTVNSFAGKSGVITYLTKTCDGIGEKSAGRLWAAYGPDTLDVLRNEPARVVADGILSEPVATAASADLIRERHLEATKVGLHDLLNGRGFHGRLQKQAISKWGAKAPSTIRRDPFKLLGMAGAGFSRCDRLWIDLGLRPDRLKRQAYAVVHEIKGGRDGHTWVAADSAVEAVVKACGGAAKPKLAIKLAQRAGLLRVKKDEAGAIWVALTERAEAERRIADSIKRLMGDGRTMWPDRIPVSKEEGDGLPSSHQVGELRSATLAPVGCFTGGPGTGKTHTLSFLLKEILFTALGNDSVAVAAPTGKAAVRATHSLKARGLNIRATTIHQLLEIGRNGHDGGGWGFLRNRDNPIDQRFLIIDESSMVDCTLMADLLDACAPGLYLPAQPEHFVPAGQLVPPRCRRCHRLLTHPESLQTGYGPECVKRADPSTFAPVRSSFAGPEGVRIPALPEVRSPGTHVLFVGDPNQLAPVGHGAPLRDLLASGIPTGELVEVRRNAGRIVMACRDIKAGRPVEFSPKIDLEPTVNENLKLVECGSAQVADTVVEILSMGSIRGFHAVWQTQVIVALNEKGSVARTDLNARLQKLLNPAGRSHPKCRFRVDDKIICTKNTWLRPTLPPWQHSGDDLLNADRYRDLKDDTMQVYCANGEIGRVIAVAADSCVARFGESDQLVRVGGKPGKSEGGGDGGEEKKAEGSTADFDLAYAITCHKIQGSSSPCVIVCLDDAASSIADRSWHYTALSRAEKLCIVVGPRGVLNSQAAKFSLVKRKTFLTELIRESREVSHGGD